MEDGRTPKSSGRQGPLVAGGYDVGGAVISNQHGALLSQSDIAGLKCSRCSFILRSPKQVIICGHRYCEVCIEQMTNGGWVYNWTHFRSGHTLEVSSYWKFIKLCETNFHLKGSHHNIYLLLGIHLTNHTYSCGWFDPQYIWRQLLQLHYHVHSIFSICFYSDGPYLCLVNNEKFSKNEVGLESRFYMGGHVLHHTSLFYTDSEW